jgi:L-aspartate oxidase
MNNTDYFETDVLIIGCGIAGGTAALQLADAGVSVTVVTRAQEPHESNTFYAQGGIIYRGEHDSPRLLVEDVLRAGAKQGNINSINILAQQGPELVEKILLERVGVAFDRNGDNSLSLAREGGHTLPRIIHAADATGKAISTALLEALNAHPRVTLLNHHTAIDLIISGHSQPEPWAAKQSSICLGAYLLDRNQGRVVQFRAKNTVLATGGLGQVFRCTTNPAGARGDGIAMADRAGAQVSNMEYVQFHPTAFYHPQAFPFLITEAVRGAGARLVDASGAPFMPKYEPEWQDLAPRDVVARSVYQEMMAQNVPNVYLDLASYISTQEILHHFPTIYSYCLNYGLDITRDLVPVVPAAHYACGGVWTNAWGQTSLDRLYAVGEVACTGVHGANRLASTSLLEGLVWGYRAAMHIQARLEQQATMRPAAVVADDASLSQRADTSAVDRQMAKMKQLMWEHVGLIRTTVGLKYAVRELLHLKAEVEALYQGYYPSDELIGLRNAAQTALLIATAALRNKNSMGCHYRVPEGQLNSMGYQPAEASYSVPALY